VFFSPSSARRRASASFAPIAPWLNETSSFLPPPPPPPFLAAFGFGTIFFTMTFFLTMRFSVRGASCLVGDALLSSLDRRPGVGTTVWSMTFGTDDVFVSALSFDLCARPTCLSLRKASICAIMSLYSLGSCGHGTPVVRGCGQYLTVAREMPRQLSCSGRWRSSVMGLVI
jgi:hypothetical protein